MGEDEEEGLQEIFHLHPPALPGPTSRPDKVLTKTGDHHKLTIIYLIELPFSLQDFCRMFPPGSPTLQVS